jgi:DNA repair protein RAD16
VTLKQRQPMKAIAIDGDDESDGSGLEMVGESWLQARQKSSSKSVNPAEANESRAHATQTDPDVDAGKLEQERGLKRERPNSDDDVDSTRDFSGSPLFRFRWERVVLDEAHRIKARTNSTAQAALTLKARHRWCLSGTPLQNKVGELYSTVRFLHFYPYAHYFCKMKGCDCCSLHHRFDPETSKCLQCGHSKMKHVSHFVREVSNPIIKYGFMGLGKIAMEKLRHDILSKILLRRTKTERQAEIQLPSLTINIRRDELSPEEMDFYKSMYQQSLTEFDTYVNKGTLLHNFAHVFHLIMRLRQAVDHPYLIVHGSLKNSDGSDTAIPTQSRGEADVCSLCMKTLLTTVRGRNADIASTKSAWPNIFSKRPSYHLEVSVAQPVTSLSPSAWTTRMTERVGNTRPQTPASMVVLARVSRRSGQSRLV